MLHSIARSSTSCFGCLYMHVYRVTRCSHTLCRDCFYDAVEEKVRSKQDAFICPRCPSSTRNQYEHHRYLSYASRGEFDSRPVDDANPANVTSLEYATASSTLWLNGDTSWHVHDIKPQRDCFINGFDVTRSLPDDHYTAVWHSQHIADLRLYTANDSFCTEPQSQLIVSPGVTSLPNPSVDVWLDGTESWHFHDHKPQREVFAPSVTSPPDAPHTKCDFSLDSPETSVETVSMLAEAEQSVSLVPIADYSSQTINSLSQTNLAPQHRRQSLHINHARINFLVPRKSTPVLFGCRFQQQFLSRTGSFLTLFLITLLCIGHNLVCNHHSKDERVLHKRYNIQHAPFSITSLNQYLETMPIFVRSVETLRNLESLLIYSIT
jgi:hypothetical protein